MAFYNSVYCWMFFWNCSHANSAPPPSNPYLHTPPPPLLMPSPPSSFYYYYKLSYISPPRAPLVLAKHVHSNWHRWKRRWLTAYALITRPLSAPCANTSNGRVLSVTFPSNKQLNFIIALLFWFFFYFFFLTSRIKFWIWQTKPCGAKTQLCWSPW